MNWLSQGTTLLNSTMYLTGQDTETVMTCTDEHSLAHLTERAHLSAVLQMLTCRADAL